MAADKRRDLEQGSLFWFGMVFVSIGPAGITIRWSVKDVHDFSLVAAIRFLVLVPDPRRVVVEYFFGGWEWRVAENPQAAINMLEAARGLRSTVPIMRPFVKQMALSDIRSANPLLRSGYGTWERADGVLAVSGDTAMRCYLEHCLVFSPSHRTDKLIYRYLGQEAALTNFKGRNWAASVLGKSCGRAWEGASPGTVSDVYEDVLRRDEPRYDHIRARIPRAGREVEWVSYQRLLTPMKDRHGCPALLCLAVTTPDVNIPVPVQIPSGAADPAD